MSDPLEPGRHPVSPDETEPSTSSPPVALTVAGSDSSAGAGIQADLKTFAALDVFGVSALTCVVAEIPGRVTRIDALPPAAVSEQIRVLFEGFPIAAMKTGMLYSRQHIEATAAALEEAAPGVPLVVDPVMVATSGDPLLLPAAVDLYKTRLFPVATIITPNLDEAAVLLDRRITTLEELEPAACELRDRFGCAVLLKGGHLEGPEAVDLLALADGTTRTFREPFVSGVSTHGTGCTFSAAIAAGLARGLGLVDAVHEAKRFVTRAIAAAWRWPGGIDVLRHTRAVRATDGRTERS